MKHSKEVNSPQSRKGRKEENVLHIVLLTQAEKIEKAQRCKDAEFCLEKSAQIC